MKKFKKCFCLLICCVIGFIFTSCKPAPIELNSQNINEYLNMSMLYDNDSYYNTYENSIYYHSIDVVYFTKPIKSGTFEDVVITVEYNTSSTYRTDSSDYAYVDDNTLKLKCSIPFDGQYNEAHNIHASGMEGWGGSFISRPTGSCDWKIVSVSGSFYPE